MDLDLYYSVYNRYRPEIDESNAESADRFINIETEYLHLRQHKKQHRTVNNNDSSPSPHLDHHSLSPFQPTSGTLRLTPDNKSLLSTNLWI